MAAPRLVSVARAKEHLRVTHDAEDGRIEFLCDVASSIVLNHLWQYPRTTYQSLPVYDPDIPPQPFTAPWPWVWTGTPPYWWPATRVSYQQLPPYLVDEWMGEAGSPSIPPDIPGEVVMATLMVITNIFDTPHENPISEGVRRLLVKWHDPAMA
jgi:hypothetical protein